MAALEMAAKLDELEQWAIEEKKRTLREMYRRGRGSRQAAYWAGQYVLLEVLCQRLFGTSARDCADAIRAAQLQGQV